MPPGSTTAPETYVCVDVETAGPVPGKYALLSIGACLIEDRDEAFYVELKPERDDFEEEALAITGLSLERLTETGVDPVDALTDFAAWLEKVVPAGNRAVFVALNAPFDWMFVADAFGRHLGHNPFGYSALDIKAFYMGMTGEPWSRTGMNDLGPRYLGGRMLTHNALADAQDQAEIFAAILAERAATNQRENR